MPKIKSHKGTQKVLNKRKNDVKIGHPGTRHNTGKKNAASNRSGRTASSLSKADANRFKKVQF
ncbi:MAG: 50S ribosomal protein L35 [Firmicutes bacterium]|nr:50S ribosomal protein L35 [Bacillota bacterium]